MVHPSRVNIFYIVQDSKYFNISGPHEVFVTCQPFVSAYIIKLYFSNLKPLFKLQFLKILRESYYTYEQHNVP